MREPVYVELIEVLTPRGEIIPQVTLQRETFPPEGRTSPPWFPAKVLIPPSLKDSFRHIFPDEFRHPGTECKIVEDIGVRHVLALYDAPPPLEDIPEPEPEVVEAPAPYSEPKSELPAPPAGSETPATPGPVTLRPAGTPQA